MSSLTELETFAVALKNLKQQKVRSLLTLIGIVIGVGSIVALVSLGQGLNLAVEQQFQMLGSNTIIIVPGKTFMQSPFSKLQEDDAETVESVRGVDFAVPIYMSAETINYKGDSTTALVFGIDPEKQGHLETIGTLKIANLGEGRALNSAEKYGVLLGNGFAEDAFDSRLGLREKLSIGNHNLRIVGIVAKSGQAFGAMFDRAVIMNYETLKEISSDSSLAPFRVIAKAENKDEIGEVKERIRKALKKSHSQEDFMITTAATIAETAGSVLGVIQLFLVGLAAISLLVGGIGIMNTMFMTVIERTKEIGVMKAIGATNRKVLAIFLLEAGFIGIIGGLGGIIFGYAIAYLVAIIAAIAGFELVIALDYGLIGGALLFAMLVGMVSGFIPARMASSLDPVVALRFE